MFEKKEIKTEESKETEVERVAVKESSEKEISPEQFSQETITKMQEDLNAMVQDGNNRLAKANESVGLERQELENVREEMEVGEKLSEIKKRASKLFKKTKLAMRNAVAIGMATMAFAGPGEFKESHNKSSETVETITSTENSGKIAKTEEGLLKEYESAMKEVEDIDMKQAEENQKNIPRLRAEEIKNNLVKHISSQEYLQKLTSEFNGDVGKAVATQRERLEYLDNHTISFMSLEEINNEYYNRQTRLPKWLNNIMRYFDNRPNNILGFRDSIKREIVIQDVKNDETARHELLHASTQGDVDITDSAKKILNDSYKKMGTKEDSYFSKATERLVRKQQVDFEMEKLGIKKYGEKFTNEHYKKLMEYYEKGKLSSNACDFIETTKPEYFEKIFNEIAENDQRNSYSAKA